MQEEDSDNLFSSDSQQNIQQQSQQKLAQKQIQKQSAIKEPLIKQSQYKIIHIQDLQDKGSKSYYKFIKDEQLLQAMASASLPAEQKKNRQPFNTYFLKDTHEEESRLKSAFHNFVGAFLRAYNSHGNLVLVPDDIWLMITLYFSKYVQKHAQKLRSQLVKHQNKMQLVVIEQAETVQQSQAMEKQWNNFLEQIIKQIQSNTINSVVQLLKCDFSTTTKIHELASISVIMGAFKKYFNYRRGVTRCGISKVYFKGILEDWQKLSIKLEKLSKYDVDGSLNKYINSMSIILRKFQDSFEGIVDIEWWNQVINQRFPSSGEQFINGWLLHFFGIYEEIPFASIPRTLITVPITLQNQLTNKQKSLQMLTDWGSFSEVQYNTFKPNITISIIQRLNQIKE